MGFGPATTSVGPQGASPQGASPQGAGDAGPEIAETDPQLPAIQDLAITKEHEEASEPEDAEPPDLEPLSPGNSVVISNPDRSPQPRSSQGAHRDEFEPRTTASTPLVTYLGPLVVYYVVNAQLWICWRFHSFQYHLWQQRRRVIFWTDSARGSLLLEEGKNLVEHAIAIHDSKNDTPKVDVEVKDNLEEYALYADSLGAEDPEEIDPEEEDLDVEGQAEEYPGVKRQEEEDQGEGQEEGQEEIQERESQEEESQREDHEGENFEQKSVRECNSEEANLKGSHPKRVKSNREDDFGPQVVTIAGDDLTPVDIVQIKVQRAYAIPREGKGKWTGSVGSFGLPRLGSTW